VKDKEKADLIEGTIYMASPDNLDANDLAAWLMALMFCYVQHTKAGQVYHSRVAFRLDQKNAPEPDVPSLNKAE